MLSTSLKKPPKDLLEPPFYTGPIDGAKTQQTQDLTKQAVSNWRVARGFGPGFTLDTTMRHQLFNEYMDAICHDDAGERFVLQPTDFIAKGKAGKSLRGDVQGCSDFNTHFLLSKAKEDSAAKDPVLAEVRNDLYLDNRRAVVFAFQYGTEIDPTKWPVRRLATPTSPGAPSASGPITNSAPKKSTTTVRSAKTCRPRRRRQQPTRRDADRTDRQHDEVPLLS